MGCVRDLVMIETCDSPPENYLTLFVAPYDCSKAVSLRRRNVNYMLLLSI